MKMKDATRQIKLSTTMQLKLRSINSNQWGATNSTTRFMYYLKNSHCHIDIDEQTDGLHDDDDDVENNDNKKFVCDVLCKVYYYINEYLIRVF